MPGHPATLRPGLHSDEQRRNFLEASRRFWFGTGADARRSGASHSAAGIAARCMPVAPGLWPGGCACLNR